MSMRSNPQRLPLRGTSSPRIGELVETTTPIAPTRLPSAYLVLAPSSALARAAPPAPTMIRTRTPSSASTAIAPWAARSRRHRREPDVRRFASLASAAAPARSRQNPARTRGARGHSSFSFSTSEVAKGTDQLLASRQEPSRESHSPERPIPASESTTDPSTMTGVAPSAVEPRSVGAGAPSLVTCRLAHRRRISGWTYCHRHRRGDMMAATLVRHGRTGAQDGHGRSSPLRPADDASVKGLGRRPAHFKGITTSARHSSSTSGPMSPYVAPLPLEVPGRDPVEEQPDVVLKAPPARLTRAA